MKIRGSLAVMAGALVAVAGLGVASAQFVSLDGSATHLSANKVDSSQRVTKTFDHTPAREVVEWARARNLPVTIADADIPDRDVTLQLESVEADEVGPMLAKALGMQATKTGDRYVLSPAEGPDVDVQLDSQDAPKVAELSELPGDLARLSDLVGPAVAQAGEGAPAAVGEALKPAISAVSEIPNVFEKVRQEMGLKSLKDIDKADEKTKARFKELVQKHMAEWGNNFGKSFDSKAFEAKMEAWAKKFDSPEFKAKMEAFGKGFAQKYDSPEFKAKMQAFGDEMKKKFDSPEFKAKMEAFSKEWNSPERKAEMEKWAQDMRAHAGDMKLKAEDMKKMQLQMQKELQKMKTIIKMDGDKVVMPDGKVLNLKEMEKDGHTVVLSDGKTLELKSLGDQDGKFAVLSGDGKGVTLVGPDGKQQALAESKDSRAYTIVTPRGKGIGHETLGFHATADSIRQLLKSMTPRQEGLMKTQGYLTPADLTPAQRELLGNVGTGDFEIMFSIDGKSIRIKGKEPKAVSGTGVF